jgi:hypothetical protein
MGMKEGAVIRFLLVALPAGLLVLGVGAMFYSQVQAEKEPADPNEKVRLEAAGLQQRPVGEEDLSRSLTILTGQLGDRGFPNAGSLEKTGFWLESTLGGGNIGYPVERHGFEVPGRELRNLVAELPGGEGRAEIIVVGVSYDTSDGDGGIASFLSLARAFAGDSQARTVRFVAFVNGAPVLEAESRGGYQYAMRCRSRGEKVVAMLSLETVGGTGKESRLDFSGDESARYFIDSAKGAFARGSSRPISGGVVTGEALAATEGNAAGFALAGIPAVRVVETSATMGPLHTPDLTSLAEVTRGLEQVLRVWANP